MTQSDLKPSSRHVALTLSLFYSRSGVAFPSVETLAERTGLGRSTVFRALEQLKDGKWIAVQSGGGRRRSNRYRMTFPNRLGVGPFEPETVPERDRNRPGAGPEVVSESVGTYDEPKDSEGGGRGRTSAQAVSEGSLGSEGKARTDVSAYSPASEPSTASRGKDHLRVPKSWADLRNSYGRSLRDNCEKAGASQEEADSIGRRLRPPFDAGKVKPNKKVVADELDRVREERAALDTELREAEMLDRVDALAFKVGRALAEAMRADAELEGYEFAADPKVHSDRVLTILQEENDTRRGYALYLAANHPERETRQHDDLVDEIERAILSGTVLVAGEPLSEDLDEAVTDPSPSRQEEIA